MKKSYLALMAIAAITLTGCKKDSTVVVESPKDELNIINLRDAGEVVPEAHYNLANCKPEKSKETLESFRHAGPMPVYYMDYAADVDWNQLLSDSDNRIIRYDAEENRRRRYNLVLFTPPTAVQPKRNSCSGFVCNNEAGDLLFCRNFDDDTDPMVVIFNKDVKPGEYKNVMMCPWSEVDFANLENVLTLPAVALDGMNEKGFCAAIYQLPDFQNYGNDSIIDPMECMTPRPFGPDQQTGKRQITTLFIVNRLLANCATVEDAVSYLQSLDHTAMAQWLNAHFYVADANGKCLTLEYWKGSQGQDTLIALTPEDRYKAMHTTLIQIPYEYNSIENYYCNFEAAMTHSEDFWQYYFSGKTRVGNMMRHYSLVMDEEDALRCLQHGCFAADEINKLTDWSCVYNPVKKTVLFNMHDDLSSVYSINLKEELK
ncbi:MAG: linear amide C-N hydrolase [Bacteroidales bacterium]|nr:linear amide C-N hydrolase [Bacteroidales bacterium]